MSPTVPLSIVLSVAAALGTAPLTSSAALDDSAAAASSRGVANACALATDTLAALDAEPGDGLPDSAAGNQLRWVLEESADAGADEFEERFSTEFLAAVPTEQLANIFAEIGTTEITVGEVIPLGETQLVAVLDSPDGTVVATIVVEADPPHRIAGLLFQPDAAADKLPADAEAITAAVAALPGETQLLSPSTAAPAIRATTVETPPSRSCSPSTPTPVDRSGRRSSCGCWVRSARRSWRETCRGRTSCSSTTPCAACRPGCSRTAPTTPR